MTNKKSDYDQDPMAPFEVIAEVEPEITEADPIPDPIPECHLPTEPAFRLTGIKEGSLIQIMNKPDWVQGEAPYTVVSSHCVVSSDGIKTVNTLLSNCFATIAIL
jgi:hypothetical protein